jgi:hypothetical protein
VYTELLGLVGLALWLMALLAQLRRKGGLFSQPYADKEKGRSASLQRRRA